MPVWCVARPAAAPCGHFAALPLVRSTFGLRGYPPLRFGAFPHSALAVKQAHDALNQSLCGIRRDTPARGFGRSSLVVCRRGVFNHSDASWAFSDCGVGAVFRAVVVTSENALFLRVAQATCVPTPVDLRLPPRYARPWFRAVVIGGGSTGVLCSVVAFATIRDPPG